MITTGQLAAGDKAFVSGKIVKTGYGFVIIEIKTGNGKTQKIKIYTSDSSAIMPL